MGSSSSNKTAEKSSSPPPSLFQTVAGGLALFVFLVTWFASAASPILGMLWIYRGQYIPVFFLLAVTIIAHLPWNKGYLSNMITDFARHNPYYYRKCGVVYQTKESLPQTTSSSVSTTEKDQQPQRPSLYAVHPHGAFCMGWSVLFCSKIMNEGKVRFCFSPVLYASPFFRLWCRLVGRPGSASKASMIGYMKNKDHLALPPGGFEEATITCWEKDRVFIKKRIGFVKLAVQNGYNLVPVYAFGENQTYSNVQGMWKLRLWLNGMGVPAIVVFGAWHAPLLPKRNPRGLLVVVGKPIVLPTISNPTREEVKLCHDKYVAALIRLFEEHKEDYYGPEVSKTVKLELW